jgi:hypothetical protein
MALSISHDPLCFIIKSMDKEFVVLEIQSKLLNLQKQINHHNILDNQKTQTDTGNNIKSNYWQHH